MTLLELSGGPLCCFSFFNLFCFLEGEGRGDGNQDFLIKSRQFRSSRACSVFLFFRSLPACTSPFYPSTSKVGEEGGKRGVSVCYLGRY